jgi:hypothetical protein
MANDSEAVGQALDNEIVSCLQQVSVLTLLCPLSTHLVALALFYMLVVFDLILTTQVCFIY